MTTLSKMLPPKITLKYSEKCDDFDVILRLNFELTFLLFRCAFSHWRETSLKNPHCVTFDDFYNLHERNAGIELSPARQAQNAIFDFSKSYTLCMLQKVKIELSPTREHHFYSFARVQENV